MLWLTKPIQLLSVYVFIGRFQEVDRSLSLYVYDQSVLEEEWTRKVVAALSETAEYTMVSDCLGALQIVSEWVSK